MKPTTPALNTQSDIKSKGPVISDARVEREREALTKSARLQIFHWIAVILSVVVTLAAWHYSKTQADLRTQVRFNAAVDQVADLIKERLQKYELALWGGVSAITLQEEAMDLANWQRFSRNLEIEKRYPGINGIGVIYQVQPQDLKGFLEEQRTTRPDFKIYPEHDRDVFQPITYIEPVAINAEAVGLDMVHEPNRRESLMKARDSGDAQITGPIVLVQDKDRTPGFLLFAPFYKRGDISTPEARQARFEGAVYAPFIVKKLMRGALNRDRRPLALRIRDAGTTIYDEIDTADPDYDQRSIGEKRITMNLYGRDWIMDVRAGLEFRKRNFSLGPIAILVAGLLIDLALLALFIMVTRANRRGLRFADMATEALDAESQALKEANDQLNIAHGKAEQVSHMKSVFLSSISHEVRTPLTAISGILVLLDRAKLPEKQNKLVQAGRVASERLIKLLTDVLDVTRLEANAVALWERTVKVRPLVEEWSNLLEGMIEKAGKDIVVETEIAADVPEAIVVDDIRLSQVMNNLMDNAIRFTTSGEITFGADAVAAQSGAPASLVISIKDSGVGIAKEHLDLIFERFRQIDGTMTRTKGGSGLGLAICSDLVKLMGGAIDVRSEPDVGTVFEVTLPVDGKGQVGGKVV